MRLLNKSSALSLTLVSAALLIVTPATNAQVNTTTATTQGVTVKHINVDRGEVESVSGNDIWVKMEDGQIRHFASLPANENVTVDGNELSIHELKPGMKLQRTLATTITPRIVTTVQTVTGKVWHVNPPKTVVLTLENGDNQQFTVPDGQRFTINGQETDVWHLKKGMMVTAVKTTEAPEFVVERQRKISGSMPPSVPELPANEPVLIARVTVIHGPAVAVVPGQLPKTGSSVPLIGLLGLLFSGTSLCLRLALR